MARRKRAHKAFTESIKRNENGGVNITKRTIEEKKIHSLFDFGGTITDDKQALQAIITECNESGIEYTLSAYCKGLLKQGAAV